MPPRILPAVKGLITACLIIAASLLLYYSNQYKGSYFQYIPFLLYAAGILWTLLAYRRSGAGSGKFSELFGQGFRCFIVVTLIMVVFVWIFTLRIHSEFREESTQAYREFLVKEKQKMPTEIDAEVATYHKQFNARFISASIFGYLIIGAGVTLALSALLMRRNQ